MGYWGTMSSGPSRRLLWIPIIHTEADLGSMHGIVRQHHVRRAGHKEWQRHRKTVAQLWVDIQKSIERLEVPADKIRLYQDGLPNCGREAEIVRDLAQAGSPNYQILLDLMARGAKLTGTEAPELLLEEYELARQMLVAEEFRPTGEQANRRQELSQQLLAKRDAYIAERIDKTLQVEETGLLFLGMLHSIESYLPADIQVAYLGKGDRK